MAVILTCACGERFDVPAREARKQVPCPACGKAVDVPQEGVVGLSSSKYLAAAQARQEEEFQKLPECPRCDGSGRCQECGGAKGPQSDGAAGRFFLSALLSLITDALLGVWVIVRKGEWAAGPSYCSGCNGNGRCYTCKGAGRVSIKT